MLGGCWVRDLGSRHFFLASDFVVPRARELASDIVEWMQVAGCDSDAPLFRAPGNPYGRLQLTER